MTKQPYAHLNFQRNNSSLEPQGPRFRTSYPLPENAKAPLVSYADGPNAYGSLRVKSGHLTGPGHAKVILNAVGSSIAIILYVFVALPLLCQGGYPVWAACLMGILVMTLTIISISFLMAGCLTDPGAIPRGRAPTQAFDPVNGNRLYGMPEKIDVVIHCTLTKLKWCKTCHIYRPPRTVHCSTCNICVERFDHHCPWMGNCVGKRNYFRFFLYVNTMFVVVVFTTIGVITGFISVAHHPVIDDITGASAPHWPTLIVLLIVAMLLVCTGWFPIWISIYHWKLAAHEMTTYEDIKGHYDGIVNPFDRGNMLRNVKQIMTTPLVASLFTVNKTQQQYVRIFEPSLDYWRSWGEDVRSSLSGHTDSMMYDVYSGYDYEEYYPDDERSGTNTIDMLNSDSCSGVGSAPESSFEDIPPYKFQDEGIHARASPVMREEGKLITPKRMMPNIDGELSSDTDSGDEGEDASYASGPHPGVFIPSKNMAAPPTPLETMFQSLGSIAEHLSEPILTGALRPRQCDGLGVAPHVCGPRGREAREPEIISAHREII